MLITFLAAFFFSLVVGVLVIRYAHLHEHLTSDHDTAGVQKFHAAPVPRIGGIPLLFGLLAGQLAWHILSDNTLGLMLAVCALPAFLAGLTEDMTKRISPLWRLLATFAAALVAAWWLGDVLNRFDLPWVDRVLLSFPLLALFVTVVAVGGVAHAVNIIDGYNGLAGVVAVLIFGALSYVCFKVGDYELLSVAVAMTGAVAGFLIWNFPRGLIFAGDGGAYLLGFMIAELSVLLVVRHREVSAWFPMLLVTYPVWETLFSVYRKKIIRGQSPGMPDGLHFHMLVYKRLVRWMVGSRETQHLLHRNSRTSPYLWGVASLTVIPAILFWQNTLALQLACLIFAVGYVWLYRRIVRFRSPRWMVTNRSADPDR